jgi:putative phage-type endonuclease
MTNDSVAPKKKQLGLTPKQLELRRNVIGGTDSSAILGVSTYRNAFNVYEEKVGIEAPRGDMSPEALWGLILEPVIRDWYRQETGISVRKPRGLLRHPEHRWLGGHLDGAAADRVLEVKTARTGADWGEPGSDEIPLAYKVQVLHYLLVTGLKRADVAVLIGGSDYRVYSVYADAQSLRDLYDEIREFREKHIIPRVPPEFDGSASASRYIRRRYPADDGSQLVAMPHQYAILDDFLHARHKAALWTKQEERLKQAIQAAMGEARALLAPGLKITYGKAKDHEETEWKLYAEALERAFPCTCNALPENRAHTNACALSQMAFARSMYTRTVEGVRRFTVKATAPQLEGGPP